MPIRSQVHRNEVTTSQSKLAIVNKENTSSSPFHSSITIQISPLLRNYRLKIKSTPKNKEKEESSQKQTLSV